MDETQTHSSNELTTWEICEIWTDKYQYKKKEDRHCHVLADKFEIKEQISLLPSTAHTRLNREKTLTRGIIKTMCNKFLRVIVEPKESLIIHLFLRPRDT